METTATQAWEAKELSVPTYTNSLLKSLPFRLALAFTVLYVVCFSVGAYLYVEDLQKRMQERVDISITNKYNEISAVYDAGGVGAVEQLMNAQSSNPMLLRYGYHLAGLDGERSVGNIPTVSTEKGFVDVSAAELAYDSNRSFRFFTGEKQAHLLTVGRGVPNTSKIGNDLLLYCLPNLIWPVLLALLGGLFLAHRSHTRVQAVVDSMDSVAKGDLSARLPVGNREDAIDNLSSNMNGTLDLLAQQIRGMKQVGCNMAHDLKTPLNRLYGKIEKASENIGDTAQVQTNLDDALEEADQLNGMIEALIRISQIEAGARKSKFVATDLLSTIESACEIYEAVADEKSQVISMNLPTDAGADFEMLGDKHLLMQMTVHVLENAIGHCPDGSRIDVNASVKGDRISLSVCDNGPGIPAGERDRVFDRLYRLEESRTTKGAGVGLSFVKAIVELHGGSVTLHDNMPGLCVEITFEKYKQA